MGIIKDLLNEELENSLRLKKEYAEAYKLYPGGTIIKKVIRGHQYYYLAFREGKKVQFVYKGKKVSKDDLRKLKDSKRLKVKYKGLIRKLDKRIKYLKKAMHGKEE